MTKRHAELLSGDARANHEGASPAHQANTKAAKHAVTKDSTVAGPLSQEKCLADHYNWHLHTGTKLEQNSAKKSQSGSESLFCPPGPNTP